MLHLNFEYKYLYLTQQQLRRFSIKNKLFGFT